VVNDNKPAGTNTPKYVDTIAIYGNPHPTWCNAGSYADAKRNAGIKLAQYA
jgi:hypothetical protein